MLSLRLAHLLLGLALLAWTGVSGSSKCEEDCKVEDQEGFFRERPQCECGSGYYKPCTNGAYYAHSPTMCIYVSRQEFTHAEAAKFCAKRFENSGFLAFVEHWDESYDISHYVWNDLKQGVEGNETHFWTSGKFSTSQRTNQTFWLYEYGNNFFAKVPDTLFPTNDSTRTDAELDGRHCIAGHTEHYDKLWAKNCSEKLPAVCYYYRETVGWYCPAFEGTTATLFRGKCYYRYSAPVPYDEHSEETNKYYKTWFEAREECAKLGAKLASVHNQVTHEKLLQLSAGKETETSVSVLQESTWIGLQLGTKGCWWGADERPLLENNDPDPKNGVDHCNISDSNTFRGRWEDGQLYNHTESENFWAPYEPNENSWGIVTLRTIRTAMPRKRKYEEFFVYEANGSASCRILGCSRPVIARSQSTGMPKHLKVHHPDKYLSLQTAQISKDVISASSDQCSQAGISEQSPEEPQDGGGTANEQGGVPEDVLEDVGGADANDPVPEAADDAVPAEAHDEADNEPGVYEADKADYDSEQEWEVDAVLEKRVTVEYLVKWKDYGESSNSWEPAANLTHCDELLEDFHGPHPPDNTDEFQSTSAICSSSANEEDAGLPDL